MRAERASSILAARRPPVEPIPHDTDWIPLAAGARVLQHAKRGSDLDRLSRGLSDNDETLQAFWAQQVAKIGVPVHGRRIMSSRSEVVPASAIVGGRLLDDATRLETIRHEPLRDICDLRIRRSDLAERLQRLEQTGTVPASP